ncbi:hypothetical protein [Albibacterium indicum]|uniref:hypothetical protein n=1 Tax=Albibacterium indicum TaxID=2292082 RepID=UPI000E4F44A0|nr:hypothetical protein [Pedobacter indicus]
MSFEGNELYHIEEWTGQSPYIKSYYAKIQHKGLGRLLLLKDFDRENLQRRINEQLATWDTIWKLEQYKKDNEPNSIYNHEFADQLTALSKSNLKLLKDILLESLNTEIQLDWDRLKDHATFPISNPESALLAEIDDMPFPVEPLFKELPTEPDEERFIPQLGFFDKLFAARGKQKKDEAEAAFKKAKDRWEAEVTRIETENRELRNDYLSKLAEAETLKKTLIEQCEQKVNEWHRLYREFTDKKDAHNNAIDQWKRDFSEGKEKAVNEYYDFILHYSAYPDIVSKIFELTFNEDEKLFVVDYLLPAPRQFPNVSEVRFIPPRGILKDSYLSERQFSRLYNDAIYKMALRTLYEVFKTDDTGIVKELVYNGWVVDDKSENPDQRCLISLRVSKENFAALDLQYVDAKTCFEQLNGRVKDDLTFMNPVEPFVRTRFTFS